MKSKRRGKCKYGTNSNRKVEVNETFRGKFIDITWSKHIIENYIKTNNTAEAEDDERNYKSSYTQNT